MWCCCGASVVESHCILVCGCDCVRVAVCEKGSHAAQLFCCPKKGMYVRVPWDGLEVRETDCLSGTGAAQQAAGDPGGKSGSEGSRDEAGKEGL